MSSSTIRITGTLVNIVDTDDPETGRELLFVLDALYVGQQHRERMRFDLPDNAEGERVAERYRSDGYPTNARVTLVLDETEALVSVIDHQGAPK